MKNDAFGDRMKAYEAATEINLMPGLPVVARIDGRSFHTFTRGMKRPYDEGMSNMMIDTARRLAIETNPVIAYTQSDEITLIWYAEGKSQIWFNGRHSKMVSNLASLATLYFYQSCMWHKPDYCTKNPSFDCRVFGVPTKQEACNCLIWREQDATKNAVSMSARAYYSDKECHGKNGREKQEMLFQKGVNFNDYPRFFRRGTILVPVTKTHGRDELDLSKLGPKHPAKNNPNFTFERTEWESVDWPVLTKISNLVDIIFDGAVPCTKASK